MSKYTTEVRFICEQAAGLTDSVGLADIDDVLENSYAKIFKVDKIPMFEGETAEHRKELYKKILGHYYTREIGFEVVGLWKQKLNQRMMEIMPYYNQLYKSELIEFDPMLNINKTITDAEVGTRNATGQSDRTNNETRNESSNTILRHERKTTRGNDTNTNVINSNADTWTLFSDTPEGGINGISNASSGNSVGNNAYLTNATHQIVTPAGQTNTNTFGDVTEKYNPTGDNTDSSATAITDAIAEHNSMTSSEGNKLNGEHHITGKEGVESYSKLLQQYRETMLNIDMMVIDALSDLFLNLW